MKINQVKNNLNKLNKTLGSINWTEVTNQVRNLQNRIAEDSIKGNLEEVLKLQRVLVTSYEARAFAVRDIINSPGALTPGVDGVRVTKDSESKSELANKMMQKIAELNHDEYKASPVRRVYIPKSNGKLRPLGIPTIFDRCIQCIYNLALAPVAESRSDVNSFGFRPGRSQRDALLQLWKNLNVTKVIDDRYPKGHYYMPKDGLPRYVLDADIRGFFDNISHDWMLENIPMDKRILREFLEAGYSDRKVLNATTKGVPQGGVISPTLANMVLDGLEAVIERHRRNRGSRRVNVRMVRYADDFVVICPWEDRLQRIQSDIESFLNERGLELNLEKTKIVDMFNSKEGFKFLGCLVQRSRRTSKSYQSKQQNIVLNKGERNLVDKTILIIKPHPESVVEFRRKIKKLTLEVPTFRGFNDLVEALNPILRGWYNYYKSVNSTNVFQSVDITTFECVYSWLQRKYSTKSWKFINKKCGHKIQGRSFLGYWRGKVFVPVFTMNAAGITRHDDVCENLNFYLTENAKYFEERKRKTDKLS